MQFVCKLDDLRLALRLIMYKVQRVFHTKFALSIKCGEGNQNIHIPFCLINLSDSIQITDDLENAFDWLSLLLQSPQSIVFK